MPALTELDGRLVRWNADGVHTYVDLVADAHGVEFRVPTGAGYWVRCWFARPAADGTQVPDTEEPLPERWAVTGTALADLTLLSRVDVWPGGWHAAPAWTGHITDGAVGP